jgi:hypothetical protein
MLRGKDLERSDPELEEEDPEDFDRELEPVEPELRLALRLRLMTVARAIYNQTVESCSRSRIDVVVATRGQRVLVLLTAEVLN